MLAPPSEPPVAMPWSPGYGRRAPLTYAAGDPRKQQASIVPAMPFESVRDYVAALERRGRLLRLPAMDQDRYEASAFAYRLIERFGIEQAPAFLIERLKIGGRWRDGPVVANAYGRWPDEALLFGVDQVIDDPQQM